MRSLVGHGVDFVVIGGLAGMARGSSYPSYDLDIAYAQGRENLEALAGALRDLGATSRGAPADLPFILDGETLVTGGSAFGSGRPPKGLPAARPEHIGE